MVSNLIVKQGRHCFLIPVEFVCQPCLPKSSRKVPPGQVRMISRVACINCCSVPLSLWQLVCISWCDGHCFWDSVVVSRTKSGGGT